MVPKGVGTASPPAKDFSPGLVWQAVQLPTEASTAPFSISAWSKEARCGGSTGSIAGFQA